MTDVLQWIADHQELVAAGVAAVLAVASLFVPGLSGIVARLLAAFLQYNRQLRRALEDTHAAPDPEGRAQRRAGPIVRRIAKTPAGRKAVRKIARDWGVPRL